VIGAGAGGGDVPTNDVGFDPNCLVKRPPVMVGQVAAESTWQYDIDIEYIQSIGGVAACFNPKQRSGAPDLGAYAAGEVATVAPGSCVPPPPPPDPEPMIDVDGGAGIADDPGTSPMDGTGSAAADDPATTGTGNPDTTDGSGGATPADTMTGGETGTTATGTTATDTTATGTTTTGTTATGTTATGTTATGTTATGTGVATQADATPTGDTASSTSSGGLGMSGGAPADPNGVVAPGGTAAAPLAVGSTESENSGGCRVSGRAGGGWALFAMVMGAGVLQLLRRRRR
jgi:hypothetical protein